MARALVLAGIAVLVLAGAACTSPPPIKPLKIGVDLPLSGPEGRAGTPALNGVQFFVNKHPTLDGFTIQLAAKDDAVAGRHDPEKGASNIQALAADPLVMGVIGPFDSTVARAEIPIANTAHLALISPAVSSRCLTKEPYLPAGLSPTRTAISCKAAGLAGPSDLRPSGTNNFFRVATTDDLQGPAAADYAFKNLQFRRMAVLSDHEAYGQSLAGAFMARFVKQGGSIVARLDFDPTGSADATGFLRVAKGDGAQGIYFGGVTANHGCVIRAQMAAVFGQGDATPFIGGDGIAQDPECLRNAGANAVGIYATVPAIAAESVPTAQPIIAAFKEQFARAGDYGPYSMAAYDSTGVLYAAIDRAIKAAGGSLPARDSVVTEMAATNAFPGATGTFGFDTDGDTSLRVVSVFESRSSDPAKPWPLVGAVYYTAALPY